MQFIPPLSPSDFCIVKILKHQVHPKGPDGCSLNPKGKIFQFQLKVYLRLILILGQGVPTLLSNDILRAAAEGFLRAYGSWCSESLGVEKVKYLDACQRAPKQPHKGGPACIVQNEFFASHVTIIARQQSRATLALLAHIAWYFDAQYGLPEKLVDRKFEVQSLSELYQLFQTFQSYRNLSPRILEYLQQQRGMKEWVMSEGQERFKREVECVMLSLQESLTNVLESMVYIKQQSAA